MQQLNEAEEIDDAVGDVTASLERLVRAVRSYQSERHSALEASLKKQLSVIDDDNGTSLETSISNQVGVINRKREKHERAMTKKSEELESTKLKIMAVLNKLAVSNQRQNTALEEDSAALSRSNLSLL